MNRDLNFFYKLQGEKIIGVKSIEEFMKTPGLGFSQKPDDRLLSTNINIFGLKAIVSTVFLVIDQDALAENDFPVLFETMVFSEIQKLNYKFQDRYSKLSEAITGHSKMILVVSSFLKNHAEEFKKEEYSK